MPRRGRISGEWEYYLVSKRAILVKYSPGTHHSSTSQENCRARRGSCSVGSRIMKNRSRLAGVRAILPCMWVLGLALSGVTCGGGASSPGTTLDIVGEGSSETSVQDLTDPPPDLGEPNDALDVEAIEEDGGVLTCPAEGLMPDQCPCTENTDCEYGYCVQSAEGKVCTSPCVEECAPGWSCQLVSGFGLDNVLLCVPKNVNLCRPCESNGDCADLYFEQGERCVTYGNSGSFCGVGCGEACPDGTHCEDSVDVEGVAVMQCVTDSGECECSALAIQQGAITVCSAPGREASCPGVRTCGPEGLTPCDATTNEEVCDGVDNDCDGTIDGFTRPCDTECGSGTESCVAGDWEGCKGPSLTTCTDYVSCEDKTFCVEQCPAAPAEACNGLDDNCNAVTDEGFVCSIGEFLEKTCGEQCGLQTYLCDNSCDWGEFGDCVPGGECKSGTVESIACGMCGVKTRICSSDCGWEAFSECSDEKTCTAGASESQSCGNCGTETRTCSDQCEWSPFGMCGGSGECAPGAMGENGCGACGVQTKTCTSECAWGDFGLCTGEGGCTAGATETQSCGQCGTQTRTCTNQCKWEDFGQCGGEGACAPGDSDSTGCGQCGTQSRLCTSECAWGDYGQCAGEGGCAPGDSDSQGCGQCGTQTRTCTNDCEWDDFGKCGGQGACMPGDTDAKSCGECGIKERICSNQCGWGDFGNCEEKGVCTPGETDTNDCGLCGNKTRTCTNQCQWGGFGGCSSQGVCSPGDKDTDACGLCGNKTRTCTNECQWGGFGGCGGQGVCSPGDKDTDDCGSCGHKTRTCTNQCHWGSFGGCGGQGVCSPGDQDTDDCGSCGSKTRNCTQQCKWGGFGGCGGQGVCSPGDEESKVCKECGTETRKCTSKCKWGGYGSCIGGFPEFKKVGSKCLPSCGHLLNMKGIPNAGKGCCSKGCKGTTGGGPGASYDCTYCCASPPIPACN